MAGECYDPVIDEDGSLKLIPTAKAIEWELQSNECIKYECQSTLIMTNNCSKGEGWMVEVGLNQTDHTKIDLTELKDIISELSGTEIDEKTIGFRYSEDELTLFVIIFVEDPETAAIIQVAIEEKLQDCSSFY